MRTRSCVTAAFLAAAVLALPGCPGFTALLKGVGLIEPPVLEMPETMPEDFRLTVHVKDQANPPADYVLHFERTGKCDYEVTIRSPRRTINSGRFELLENQLTTLYALIRDQGYEQLAARYPDEGEGRDRGAGVQALEVRCNAFSKEVVATFQLVGPVEAILKAAVALVPEKAWAAPGANPTAPVSASRGVIGDMRNKLFYWSDDPRLKDVPTDVRQPFATYFDAVNFEYRPAPGVTLERRRE